MANQNNPTAQVIERAAHDIDVAARNQAMRMLTNAANFGEVEVFARLAQRALRHLSNAQHAMEQAPHCPDGPSPQIPPRF